MLYKFLYELSDVSSVFNVFRYITVRSTMAFFTAFVVCLILGPYFISKMRKIKIDEPINSDGPDSHKKKQGTPTMGGGIMLISIAIATLFWVDLSNPLVLGFLAILFGFGSIGFADDWIKIRFQNMNGLSRMVRLALEFSIALLCIGLLVHYNVLSTTVHIPFLKDFILDIGLWYILFASFVIVGMANAVNFTDGLDGLASFPIAVCALTLAVFAYLAGHTALSSYLGISYIAGASELVPVAVTIAAVSLGFLWYNAHPAQIFMGDVGSLSLGGALGVLAVFTKNEFIIPVLGGVFVVEMLSVISQVFYFKVKGKRILSMAPLHHHYELKGLSESKIIVRFWIVSVLLALISLATLKLR